MKKFLPFMPVRLGLLLSLAICSVAFGQSPALPAATTTTRAALIKTGVIRADGTITATATGTGGTSTATLSAPLGVITTGAITTAAAADHVITVTNASVTAASIIHVSVNKNGSTGWPVITSVEPGTGTYVIRITNAHATAAFNAALKLMVHVVKY
jgi:hypothetical protein